MAHAGRASVLMISTAWLCAAAPAGLAAPDAVSPTVTDAVGRRLLRLNQQAPAPALPPPPVMMGTGVATFIGPVGLPPSMGAPPASSLPMPTVYDPVRIAPASFPPVPTFPAAPSNRIPVGSGMPPPALAPMGGRTPWMVSPDFPPMSPPIAPATESFPGSTGGWIAPSSMPLASARSTYLDAMVGLAPPSRAGFALETPTHSTLSTLAAPATIGLAGTGPPLGGAGWGDVKPWLALGREAYKVPALREWQYYFDQAGDIHSQPLWMDRVGTGFRALDVMSAFGADVGAARAGTFDLGHSELATYGFRLTGSYLGNSDAVRMAFNRWGTYARGQDIGAGDLFASLGSYGLRGQGGLPTPGEATAFFSGISKAAFTAAGRPLMAPAVDVIVPLGQAATYESVFRPAMMTWTGVRPRMESDYRTLRAAGYQGSMVDLYGPQQMHDAGYQVVRVGEIRETMSHVSYNVQTTAGITSMRVLQPPVSFTSTRPIWASPAMKPPTISPIPPMRTFGAFRR